MPPHGPSRPVARIDFKGRRMCMARSAMSQRWVREIGSCGEWQWLESMTLNQNWIKKKKTWFFMEFDRDFNGFRASKWDSPGLDAEVRPAVVERLPRAARASGHLHLQPPCLAVSWLSCEARPSAAVHDGKSPQGCWRSSGASTSKAMWWPLALPSRPVAGALSGRRL